MRFHAQERQKAITPPPATVCVSLPPPKVILHNEKQDGFPLTSLREIQLLKRISHPSCVRLLDVAVGRRREMVFLVFEYCEHDLAGLLDSTKKPFSESDVSYRVGDARYHTPPGPIFSTPRRRGCTSYVTTFSGSSRRDGTDTAISARPLFYSRIIEP